MAFVVLLVMVNCLVLAGSFYGIQRLETAAAMVPNLPEIMSDVIKKPSQIVSADGVVLFTVAAEYREPVRRAEIPQRVVYATLAAEDVRFYQHSGVDPFALGRVAYLALREGKASQGGSTLTMQLAKRVYTSTRKTMERKVQDMALATMIERMLTKDQILELYLNQVFYGSGAYGIAAAADVYFGKKLDDLTVAEAALLARCVRRPSEENPYTSMEAAIKNRRLVLRTMLEEGWITESEYKQADNEPVRLRRDRPNTVSGVKVSPYFVDYILHVLKTEMPELDLSSGGYRIETTLNYKVQEKAQAEVKETLERRARLYVNTAACLVVDNDGRIIVMVGGADYNRNQYNAVWQGKRQPGSAFKPFVYATAFEFGALSARGSVRNDPYYYKWSRPRRKVQGGGSGGSVGVASAIASSINTPAVWASEAVGRENVVNLCKTAFGFKSRLLPVESMALGSNEVTMLEMAEGYSVFQQHGDRIVPRGIDRIIGPDGLTIKRYDTERVRRVISQDTADDMDVCLRQVVTSGTGTAANRIKNARGKTGTTSSHKDAWFAGYTDKFICMVWLANEAKDKSGRWLALPMRGVFGGKVSAPLWAEVMAVVQGELGEEARSFSRRFSGKTVTISPPKPEEEKPEEEIPTEPPVDIDPGIIDTPPPLDNPGDGNLVYVEVCADSGMRATVYCPERSNRAFAPGGAPKGSCTMHGAHAHRVVPFSEFLIHLAWFGTTAGSIR